MIAVSLNVGGGVRLIKPHKTVHVDGRMAQGVWGNGSVLLSLSGNVVTRIGIHTHTRVQYHPCGIYNALLALGTIRYDKLKNYQVQY